MIRINMLRLFQSALLAAAVLAPPSAVSQVRVQNDGRLFDANPQLGGSRYNDARLYSPLAAGNLIASGNARGGLSLRSGSLISDPTAFRASLGSDSLSNFLRDSVSPADIGVTRSLNPTPFYDPARVAPNATYLRGFNAPPAQPGFGRPFERRDTFPSSLSFSAPGFERLDTSIRPTQLPGSAIPSPGASAAGTIFGVQRFRQPGPVELDSTRTQPYGVSPTAVPWRDDPRAASWSDDTQRTSPDYRIQPQPAFQPMRTIIDNQIRASTNDLLAQRNLIWNQPDSAAPTTPDAPAAPPVGQPDPSTLPGFDIFTDMQLALNLQKDPQAQWYRDMQSALAGGAAATSVEQQNRHTRAAEDADEFAARVLATPIGSFAGKGDSIFNSEMLKAEAFIGVGQFVDAQAAYDRAYTIAPANPLPLIGKAHALLAAGEYAQASYNLLRGLNRFPEIAKFDIDLKALLGGGETIDLRRADIMRILERNEDARLRFLLGYLEYYAGERERGMQNLERAASDSDAGSFMRRFPGYLRGEFPGPAPSAPSAPPPGEAQPVDSQPAAEGADKP